MSTQHNPENCKEIFSLLSEYLDLELPPDACEAVEAHLAGCTPCIEFAESLRSTVALCRQYEPSELPPPLSEEAKKSIQDAWQKMLSSRTRPA